MQTQNVENRANDTRPRHALTQHAPKNKRQMFRKYRLDKQQMQAGKCAQCCYPSVGFALSLPELCLVQNVNALSSATAKQILQSPSLEERKPIQCEYA